MITFIAFSVKRSNMIYSHHLLLSARFEVTLAQRAFLFS